MNGFCCNLGVDIDYQNEKKETALHKALKMKNNHAVAILLKKGANFHIENQYICFILLF
jgi:ankyrin repeat protein